MTDDGLLNICALVNPEKMPGHRTVIIAIKLDSTELVKKGEELSRLRGVTSVAVVTGQYDLMATVLFREGFDLLEFYTQEMSKFTGVRSVETFVVYKGYNLELPYVL